jgi:hypothetical protein
VFASGIPNQSTGHDWYMGSPVMPAWLAAAAPSADRRRRAAIGRRAHRILPVVRTVAEAGRAGNDEVRAYMHRSSRLSRPASSVEAARSSEPCDG